jgi:hypothetical protein
MRAKFVYYLLIACALLFAQMAGFAHGVRHLPSYEKHQQLEHAKTGHSCVLFNALTCVQTPTSPFSGPLPNPLLLNLGNIRIAIGVSFQCAVGLNLRARGPPSIS